MKTKILSNQEPKGTRDWLPEEFAIRHYIFETWRQVCRQYGFEEYLTPLVEYAEVYRAKSGEDIGGKELVTFTDLGGRELCIRPEMTPSLTRMVSKIYGAAPKPLKYFSIANFMRNEKPQRGRNREFWQLNCDIFGSDSFSADLEVLQLSLDIMEAFGAPKGSFKMSLNSRKLLDGLLVLCGKLSNEQKMFVVRTLDKWQKLSKKDLETRLNEIGLAKNVVEKIFIFMGSETISDLEKSLPELANNLGLLEIKKTITELENLGYENVYFNPAVIRGFDYYDGLVFEVFDTHPDNNRAMFGGGRYNGLAELFGSASFPAVGFAPGDEMTRLFLESWNLLGDKFIAKTEIFYLPLLDESLTNDARKLAAKLRGEGKDVLVGFEVQKINKALESANKKGISRVIIFGSEEANTKKYKIKDMKSGKEEKFAL
ncbi:MAG: histidine--tRNA ligase [Patescibacteria group bacterium]